MRIKSNRRRRTARSRKTKIQAMLDGKGGRERGGEWSWDRNSSANFLAEAGSQSTEEKEEQTSRTAKKKTKRREDRGGE